MIHSAGQHSLISQEQQSLSQPPVDLLAQPSRDEGQEWARDELSDPIYQDADLTLFERIGRAISEFLDDLFSAAADIQSPWLIGVIILAILAMIALIVWWTRRSAGVRLESIAPRHAVFRSELDPSALRRTSAAAASAEDWRLAIQDLVRAVFAEQAVAKRITIDKSSTAQELAAAAGSARPQSAADFRKLASLFDAVSFSGDAVTREDWVRASDLDRRIAKGTQSTDHSSAQPSLIDSPQSAGGDA